MDTNTNTDSKAKSMEVVLFNEFKSKLDYLFDSICLRPLLLFADEVYYASPITTYMEDYVNRDRWHNQYFIGMYKGLGLEKGTKIPVKDIEDIEKKLKYINRIKHKNKQEVILQHTGKKMLKIIKDVVLNWYEGFLTTNGIFELKPFMERKIFHAWNTYGICQKKEEEDLYIKGLHKCIIDNDEYQMFGNIVEKLMPFVTLNKFNKPVADSEVAFIQVPLFDFPPLRGLDYQQTNYTRENLKDKFQSVKEKINEFELFVKPLAFNKENWKIMAEQFNELIHPLLEPVQHCIDNEIYIQQSRQKYKETMKVSMCLGITSISGMIDYYKKAEIIKPYVAETIIRNLARETDISKSSLFFYFRMTSENNEDDYVQFTNYSNYSKKQ